MDDIRVHTEQLLRDGTQKFPRFIISPHDHKYKIWMNFLLLLVFYTAWVSPFEFGFMHKPQGALQIADNVVNGLFAVDIILTFFVAYFDEFKHHYITEPKKIGWQYVTTWFAFDVISTIPTELVQVMLPSTFQTYSFLFNLLRLLRLRRVIAMFARWEKDDNNLNYFRVRCLKLICVTLFAIHSVGCLYYLLAAIYPTKTWIGATWPDFQEQSIWSRYVTSIYWSINTLPTLGYSDLHPQNTWDMTFDVFCMFSELGFTAYLIAAMTNLVVNGDR